MAKVKIIRKKDDYSLEYEVGDILEVQGSWYGGVHVTGKTGIPVSIDKDEYEEVKEEGKEALTLKKLLFDFTVCKVENYSQVNLDAPYCFVGKTDQEKSLVCITANTPSNTIAREDGFKAFRIEGLLDFSLLGILSAISAILAKNEIGIFAVSTFNTDYILVKAEQFDRALDLLAKEGYEVL